MRAGFVVAAALSLAGCIDSTNIRLPDGTKGLFIDCSGEHRTVEDCKAIAAKRCQGPYQIIPGSNQTPVYVALPSGDHMMVERRTLTVRCDQ
jgi:hypothetical protein